MSAERFTLDTNILIYFVNAPAGERHRHAVSIIERASRCDCWLTLQAVSEFYAAATRKGMASRQDAAAQARDWLEIFPAAAHSATCVAAALAASVAGRASFWDALLCAAAAEAGCRAILTEDMRDGDLIAGVRVVHAFADGSLSDGARALLDAAAGSERGDS